LIRCHFRQKSGIHIYVHGVAPETEETLLQLLKV